MADAVWLAVALPGALIWLAVLLLPWRPWGTQERLEAADGSLPTTDLRHVTVVIPARDEAENIGRTLAAVRGQGGGPNVVVVDDRSTDGTAATARATGLDHLRILEGTELPPGWTGKLWALEQGLAEVTTPYTLLLDADIELAPGMIAAMLEKLERERLQLVSLMATLSTGSFWERLLLPAFVYFFKLLYPFRLANTEGRRTAAAAGGCVLIETVALRRIGAFASLKNELIDDCALAARCKAAGVKTWIGLSRSAACHRRYRTLGPIWEMVARTAYSQLRSSPWLLAGCVAMLSWAFWLPIAGLTAPPAGARLAAATALVAMMFTYLPVLRYYGMSPAWALLLPLAGTLYLAMTIDSARRHRTGMRSRWKGRVYATPNAAPGGGGRGSGVGQE
jgi:hopene-associated glycosyltransferase HpnB